jgi:hypothetical protein
MLPIFENLIPIYDTFYVFSMHCSVDWALSWLKTQVPVSRSLTQTKSNRLLLP